MKSANSAYKIAKLNVLDSATHVAPSEVDIGFAAKTTLEKVYKEEKDELTSSVGIQKRMC